MDALGRMNLGTGELNDFCTT